MARKNKKEKAPPDPGKTPGTWKIATLLKTSGQPLVVGIQLPDSIFINPLPQLGLGQSQN